jgi:hypothetical protein
MTDNNTPRGIRNNNPGNIRLGEDWQGLAAQQTDGTFCQFVSPEYGIRAIAVIMQSYHTEGFTTITQIINRWAPPGNADNNDTTAYIAEVCKISGFSADKVIDTQDIDDLLGLIKGIIMEENGEIPYTDSQIEDGINLALV